MEHIGEKFLGSLKAAALGVPMGILGYVRAQDVKHAGHAQGIAALQEENKAQWERFEDYQTLQLDVASRLGALESGLKNLTAMVGTLISGEDWDGRERRKAPQRAASARRRRKK